MDVNDHDQIVSRMPPPGQPPVYTYTPLSRGVRNFHNRQIRLLTLEYSRGASSIIECDLTIHEAGDLPPYTTLSYTWEPSSPQREILVNERRLTIGDNLYQFLAIARRRYDPTTCFWIDQICIDQTNIEERNQQVSFMSDIYAQAERMVIWLGTASQEDSSDIAFAYMQSIATVAVRTRDFTLGLNETLPETNDVTIACLRGVFRRRYWDRMWIIQEIMLSGKISVRCGYAVISWADMHRFQYWTNLGGLTHWRPQIPEGSKRIFPPDLSSILQFPPNVHEIFKAKERWGLRSTGHYGLGRVFKHGTPLQKLREALYAYRNALCGNPLDKVYGILGLVKPEELLHLRVDYSCSRFQLFSRIIDDLPTRTEEILHLFNDDGLNENIMGETLYQDALEMTEVGLILWDTLHRPNSRSYHDSSESENSDADQDLSTRDAIRHPGLLNGVVDTVHRIVLRVPVNGEDEASRPRREWLKEMFMLIRDDPDVGTQYSFLGVQKCIDRAVGEVKTMETYGAMLEELSPLGQLFARYCGSGDPLEDPRFDLGKFLT